MSEDFQQPSSSNDGDFVCEQYFGHFLSELYLKNDVDAEDNETEINQTSLQPTAESDLSTCEFQCSNCNYAATGGKCDLIRHMCRVHRTSKPYWCSMCKFCTPFEQDLVKHVSDKHNNEIGRRKKKRHFPNSKRYKTLLQNQIGTPSENCIADNSSKCDEAESELSTNEFQCSICNYAAAGGKSDLIEHMSTVHSTVKPYWCSMCQYCTAFETDLVKHVSDKHNNEIGVDKRKHNFPNAIKKGKTEAPIQISRSIDNHITVNSSECDEGKRFSCTLCDFSSARLLNLEYHLTCIHKIKEEFFCPMCQYSATRKDRIAEHISTVHNRERPFSCSFCKYKCGNKNKLVFHVTTHHSDQYKPVICVICDYRTTSQKYLDRHNAKYHHS